MLIRSAPHRRTVCSFWAVRVSGLPPSSVKNILYQKSKNPKILTIKIICDGLDITLGEFFSTPEFDALEQELK